MDSIYENNMYQFSLTHAFNDSDNLYAAHWHRELEIIYIESGKLEITVNGRSFIGNDGDIFVFPFGSIHSTLGYKGLIANVLLFPPKILEHFNLETFGVAHHIPYSAQKEKGIDRILYQAFQDMQQRNQEKSSQKYNIILNQMEIVRIWTILLQHCTEKYAQDTLNSEKIDKIAILLKYIEDHYDETITLPDMAVLINYSSVYTSKLFKEFVGVSFKKYLDTFRIKKACNALKETKQTVSRIAFGSGFESLRTFNKTFRKIMNCTPVEYRDTNWMYER